ncbi:MAG TPA: DUF58 domain-containing protein [Candidatus Brocadiia bacterium]|nr:DUF58 domain-containing protein [Candidatus Brocadiia bacterium]
MGLEFSGLREYAPGDDASRIDWRATARLGKTYLRQYSQESGKPVFVILDSSASMNCASRGRSPWETACETAMLLSCAALAAGDMAGLCIANRIGIAKIKPARSRNHAWVIAAGLASFEPGGKDPDAASMISALKPLLPRRSLLIFITDASGRAFRETAETFRVGFESVAITIRDRIDPLPAGTGWTLQDVETGMTTVRRTCCTGRSDLSNAACDVSTLLSWDRDASNFLPGQKASAAGRQAAGRRMRGEQTLPSNHGNADRDNLELWTDRPCFPDIRAFLMARSKGAGIISVRK